MIYACYLNVAGLSPWQENYGLEPSGGLITPFPVSPLLAPATKPEGGSRLYDRPFTLSAPKGWQRLTDLNC